MPSELRDHRGHQRTILRQGCELGEIECFGGEEDSQERQQHRHAANHGVHQELHRGSRAAGSTPESDKEECRNQCQLPEDKPVEEVQGREGADEARLKHENQREVQRHALFNLPGRQHADWHDNRREQQHEETEPIDTHAITYVERRYPRMKLLELEPVGGAVEAVPENQRDQQRDGAERQCCPTYERLVPAAQREHRKGANQRQQGQDREPWEGVHVLSHTRAFHSSRIVNTMSAPATILRYPWTRPACSRERIWPLSETLSHPSSKPEFTTWVSKKLSK